MMKKLKKDYGALTTTCHGTAPRKFNPAYSSHSSLTTVTSDVIDFEKFTVTGNVFKMLLGSFVEEMDAIDDSAEELPSTDEALTSQPSALSQPRSPPLWSISEDSPAFSPSPAAAMEGAYAMHATESPENYTCGAQQAPTDVERSTSMHSSSTSPRHLNSTQQSPSPSEQPKGMRDKISRFLSS
jgi:hypothetical protein